MAKTRQHPAPISFSRLRGSVPPPLSGRQAAAPSADADIDQQQAVESSFVARAGYNHEEQYLLVTTNDGRRYRWSTDPEVFRQLLAAPSVGKFLSKHVFGQYPGEVFNPEDNSWGPTGQRKRK